MSDLISRQDVIDALMNDPDWAYAIPTIESIPSAICDDCIWHVCNYNKVDWDAPSSEAAQGWIPCSERMPDAEDCPMDCIVTRKSEFIGNFVDIAVAEADGTWTHEDWDAIVLGDVESGRKTGLISTHDNEIIAWMPLIPPYREDGGV